MKCPFCNAENTRVIDSRPADDAFSIRRRRQCDVCDRRFTTYEKVETMPLAVIKKDDNREPYSREKLQNGILQSCHKRPVSVEEITRIVDEVENAIFNLELREVPTSTIGELVMDKLKDVDAVAYVRFASVYREFKDVNTFMDELKKINHLRCCRCTMFYQCIIYVKQNSPVTIQIKILEIYLIYVICIF